MCGILGVIGISRCPAHLERARELMLHRGPDDGGLAELGGAWLGFRRLAILDLSGAGHQPMTSADGRVALVFNGEIYNHRELRCELEAAYPFSSRTDSEVLLAGYAAWGFDALLRRIDGMFAFAIWDSRSGVLHAARDRLGKKPFFYAHKSGQLAFASTLNALRELQAANIDEAALDDYLTYQAVPSPRTIFKGILKLPPAHSLSFDARTGALRIKRYWDVLYAPKRRIREAEALDELEHLLRAAVRRRLESDVPLGAFLSGGVDSSLVVALMAQEASGRVETVVAGFDDPAFDERPLARKVAAATGVRLHEHVVRPDMLADLPRIIWHYGEPLADVSIVPTYYVAQAGKAHFTVVLNGDGGDEAFGGYARPVVARAAQTYRRLLPAGARQILGGVLGGIDGSSPLKKLGMLARAGADTAEAAFTYDRAFRLWRSAAYTPGLLRRVGDHDPDDLYRRVWRRAQGTDDVDRALYGDLTTYLPDQLLVKMDVSTMAHSLEARSPLLDTAVIEFAAWLPTSLRLRGYTTKYLLKRLAERHVPREALYRCKRGFVMPVDEWLRGELRPYVDAALRSAEFTERDWINPCFVWRALDEHMSGRRFWGQHLWTLFVLEIWARLWTGRLRRDDPLAALL